MGDAYRNERDAALALAEALRAENETLRRELAKRRAGHEHSPATDADPRAPEAAQAHGVARAVVLAALLGAYFAALVIVGLYAPWACVPGGSIVAVPG